MEISICRFYFGYRIMSPQVNIPLKQNLFLIKNRDFVISLDVCRYILLISFIYTRGSSLSVYFIYFISLRSIYFIRQLH